MKKKRNPAINPWILWGGAGAALLLLLSKKQQVGQAVSDVIDIVTGKADKQAKWAQAFATAAQPICAKYNLPVALCVAQAAVESAWGAAAPGGNYFGIKGKGPAGSTTVTTHEDYTPGQSTVIKDAFAAYDNVEQSIEGWCKFVSGDRYTPPEGSNTASRLLWIWAAGYATATTYAQTVSSVAASVAKRIGPAFAIPLSPAQKSLADDLSKLKPADRRTKALALAKAGQWPIA
jgi:flagellar protein FlgJ